MTNGIITKLGRRFPDEASWRLWVRESIKQLPPVDRVAVELDLIDRVKAGSQTPRLMDNNNFPAETQQQHAARQLTWSNHTWFLLMALREMNGNGGASYEQ